MSATHLVRPDARRRVSLGDAVNEGVDYRVTKEPSGRVVLDPVVVVSQAEAKLAGNEEFWERVAQNQAQPRERFDLDEL